MGSSRAAILRAEIRQAEEELQSVLWTQKNHPHRYEDWNWCVEAREIRLRDLRSLLEQEMAKVEAVEEVTA